MFGLNNNKNKKSYDIPHNKRPLDKVVTIFTDFAQPQKTEPSLLCSLGSIRLIRQTSSSSSSSSSSSDTRSTDISLVESCQCQCKCEKCCQGNDCVDGAGRQVPKGWNWKIASAIAAVVTLIIIGLSVGLYFKSRSSPELTTILDTYSFLFRSEEEIQELLNETIVVDSDQVNVESVLSPELTTETNNTDVQDPRTARLFSQRRSLSSSKVVLHGCCKSHKVFKSYTQLEGVDRRMYRLVELEGLKQYFEEDQCSQVPDPDVHGRCVREMSQIQPAVVHFNGGYKAMHVKTWGCCKCLNT